MLATALLAFLCCNVMAQTSGSISGEVRDEKQAVITGATVSMRNISTNETRTTQTNADGRYHFASVPVGAYEVTVESSGFAKYQQSGITLALNQSAVVDVTMKPGALQEVVNVVENASKVEVQYGSDENGAGGRTVPATIVGRDPATDLALLKIDAQGLPSLSLGDSDRIRRGDWAIAIGNPFQLDNTLTVGVISAKGRALGMSEETRSFENFIQTDAAINFGNSGGPLLNINGEVIGINTAIRGGMAQGLGFATPVNVARRLLPQLKQGKVVRGFLGMEIREVTQDIRDAWNLPAGTTGALVNRVTPGKPADQAGLQHGDIIVEIDGRQIRSNRELIDYISYLPLGTNVKVTFLRDGQRRTVTAKTAERPPDGAVEEDAEAGWPCPDK